VASIGPMAVGLTKGSKFIAAATRQ